jgi:hypothetical protein
MGYSKRDVASVQQATKTGQRYVTPELSAAPSVEVIKFGDVASAVTFQASDNLTGTIEFSVDGENFKNSTALAASNAMTTFTTHLVTAVRITRTGGAGKVAVACK